MAFTTCWSEDAAWVVQLGAGAGREWGVQDRARKDRSLEAGLDLRG
jgi:hypothetical protein